MIRIGFIPRLAALILGASSATAETPGLALRDQAALANIAAFPKLVGTDPATIKINHDLFLRDKAVINALLDCSDDPYLSWYRWIEVPFNGPNFISFSVHDDVDCGGLHGNQNQTPLTYDRQTGDLVDWVALLPKSWIADLTENAAATLMDPQVLGSAALTQVYLSLYPRLDDPDCGPSVRSNGLSFIFWPDADSHSLRMEPASFSYADRACADLVDIPVAQLAASGADPRLVTALGALAPAP